MELAGDLSTHKFSLLLTSLGEEKTTGTLRIISGDKKWTVCLREGSIVFAGSGRDRHLSDLLESANKLTRQQVKRALQAQLREPTKHFGDILVEMGIMDEEELISSVREQINETIYDLMDLEEGEYKFEEGRLPFEEDMIVSLDVDLLIEEKAKRTEELGVINQWLPSSELVLQLSLNPERDVRDIHLSSREWGVLSLVDGEKSIAEIVDLSYLGEFEVFRILYKFFSMGLLERADEEESLPITKDVILRIIDRISDL